jgi:hypothetical protein
MKSTYHSMLVLVAAVMFATLVGCGEAETVDPSVESRAAVALSKSAGGSGGVDTYAAQLNDAGDAYCAADKPDLCAPLPSLRPRGIACTDCSGGLTVCCTVTNHYPVDIKCLRATCDGTGNPGY